MRLNQWGTIEEEDPEDDPDDPGPDEPESDYPELDYDMVVEHSVCIECGEPITMQARRDDGRPDGVWRSSGPSDFGESICYADYSGGGSYVNGPPEVEPYPHEPRVQAWEVAEAVQSIQHEYEARGGPA